MLPFMFNLLVAVAWMVLSQSNSPLQFVFGFVIGFLLLAVYSLIIGGVPYVRRTANFIRFLFVFLYAFVIANFSVAFLILFVPRKKIVSELFTYDVTDMSPSEIFLLNHCITLTPGTITAEISNDYDSLLIHFVGTTSSRKAAKNITKLLKKPILRFTR